MRSENTPIAVRLENIIDATCERVGVAVEHLLDVRRTPIVVRARWLVVAVARTCTPYSYPEIGRAMNTVHSTAITQHRRLQSLFLNKPSDDVERRLFIDDMAAIWQRAIELRKDEYARVRAGQDGGSAEQTILTPGRAHDGGSGRVDGGLASGPVRVPEEPGYRRVGTDGRVYGKAVKRDREQAAV